MDSQVAVQRRVGRIDDHRGLDALASHSLHSPAVCILHAAELADGSATLCDGLCQPLGVLEGVEVGAAWELQGSPDAPRIPHYHLQHDDLPRPLAGTSWGIR